MEKLSDITVLYHYTSLEALLNMLSAVNPPKGCLNIRLCDPLQANDKREINFFEDYVYNTKKGKIIKEKIDSMRIIDERPFVLCLIHHFQGNDEKNFGLRNYPHCEIPMWDMYANKFKGIRIGFDVKKLREHFNTHIKLTPCEYVTKTEMQKKGEELRKEIGEDCSNNEEKSKIMKVYRASVLYKTKSWVYENEWRAIRWEKKYDNIKIDPRGGKLYVEEEIPLACVREFTIGPLAKQKDVAHILSSIQRKYNDCMHEIEIKESELTIR